MRVLSFLILLIPAVYTWWYGRRLLRRTGDPQFAELHVRKAIHLGSVIGLCLGFSVVASFGYTGLKLLLVILGATAADYGYRRVIFRESWGFFAYLGHIVRFGAASFGVWILIALLPEAIRAAGDAWRPVAAGLALVIVAASQLYSWLFRRLVGAREIGHPQLEGRFAQILVKAGCRMPWIGRAGPAGGFWLNALAVPSLYRQGVVLSHDLLASLGPREATAIFAHEVGHLEQFSRKRLIFGQLTLLTLISVPLFLAYRLGPGSQAFGIVAGLWPIAVLLWICWAAARGQKHEHDSDLRALELCGEPQALIDGLTKIHLLGRMPRRWDAGHEAQMSHPSLAQRLRAIREAAGLDPPRVAELTVRAAGDRDRAVVLTADRLLWLTGTDRRSIQYTDLTDLRLVAGGRKTRQLVATDRAGTSIRMPISLDDAPAVKAALARIDIRLPGTAPGLSTAAAEASTSSAWVRVDAVLMMILGVLSPSLGTLSLASLLVLIRPAAANLAAAGTIAVASALIGLTELAAADLGDTMKLFALGAWIWFGGTFLWFAVRRFRARVEEPAWTLWTGLATLSGFAAVSLALGASRLSRSLPATQLHNWAREIPAALLLLIGLAAMLLTVRRRSARVACVVLLLTAAAIAVPATRWFRDRFGQDALAAGTPALTSAAGLLTKERELTVDDYVYQLVLSPSGERLAYSSADGGDEDEYTEADYRPSFQVELPDGSFVKVEATALEFLDDWRVVALTVGEDAMTLQVVDLLAGPAAVVEIALPPAVVPKLRLDPEIGRWHVVGTAEDGGEILHLSGTVTGALEQTERYPMAESELWAGDQTAVDARGRLLTTRQDFGFGQIAEHDQDIGGFWFRWMFTILSGVTPTSEIAVLGDSGRRVLARTASQVHCLDPAYGQDAFLCTASDGTDFGLGWWREDDTTTHLWSIDPDGGLSPIGSLPGAYYETWATGDGRILLTGYGSPPAIVDLAAGTAAGFSRQIAAEQALAPLLRQAVEFLAGVDDRPPDELFFDSVSSSFAFQSGVLGAAFADDETTTLLVYRLP